MTTGRKPDQRQVPRAQPFVAPCRVVGPALRLQGYVTDLSTRGAQVAVATTPPEKGARVTLEIRLGGRVPLSRLAATVIWQKPRTGSAGFAFGLTFEDVSERQIAILESVLAEVRKRAEALA